MPQIQWSSAYRPEWDTTPEAYVDEGVVQWGRSRRLGKYLNAAAGLKAYLGMQHYDPARWHVDGTAQSKFFLSLFVGGRTVTLRTFPTMGAAVDALAGFESALGAENGRGSTG